jgi:prefoldin subunit 5
LRELQEEKDAEIEALRQRLDTLEKTLESLRTTQKAATQ